MKQKIEGGKTNWNNWCKKIDNEIMARVISFVSQIKTGGFGMSVENARNVIKMSETYD